MAALTITDATKVHIVEVYQQETLPAGVDITAGQICRPDANGKWILADATVGGANTGTRRGFATRSAKAGMALTCVRKGLVDPETAVAALAFEAAVFLSNTPGGMDSAAGAVSVTLGTVQPGWASGVTADKLLLLDL